ncbi:DUF3617 domain-containing protein [Parablastomonas sp. CN1-191]|uniref:DUF3617 domain-containing protein n=1 Tax=Parablastomonas sp. CN1-191 TaxID=3400908 RepID=UPI003BF8EDCA
MANAQRLDGSRVGARMNPSTLLFLAIPLALAGCKKDGPPSVADVKKEAAQIARPDPGRYRSTVTVTRLSFPGMDPAMAQRMQGMFATSGQAQEFCLTRAEADKGYEAFISRVGQGDCTYDRFDASHGSLNARMTCRTGQGLVGKYDLKGQFTARSSDLAMQVQQLAGGLPGAGMTLAAHVVTRWQSTC